MLEGAAEPTPERVFFLEAALRRGVEVDDLAARTGVDRWFLDQVAVVTAERQRLEALSVRTAGPGLAGLDRRGWRRAKRLGFSDAQIAYLMNSGVDTPDHTPVTEADVRAARLAAGVRATFKTVDTCGAEFEARTPYHYATYEDEDEVQPAANRRVVILGSGPNRIGQGIEFDYCCVHASLALRAAGFDTVMVNCNPETVSTDYDTSDRLYFEPLTTEDVANVLDAETAAGAGNPDAGLAGVIVSLGGQTPLKLAHALPEGSVLGTSPHSIDLAEDRERWNVLCAQLGIPQPPGGTATDAAEALVVARRVGYPVLVRPSYVLGGRAMEIVYDDENLRRVVGELARSMEREGGVSTQRPVLVDRFLEDAVEIDVDAVRDRTGALVVAGVMEHVEEAGVHSGDSACALPPQTLGPVLIRSLEEVTGAIADALDVVGFLNVQFAVKDGRPHVLEANPRASRTVPFVAKATGVPYAMVAARVMLGATLAELRAEGLLHPGASGGHVAVKEAVLPFSRFPGVDTLLGPEMRSTGEVMGVGSTFGLAFAKSQIAAGTRLPLEGVVFFSLADRDKRGGLEAARGLARQGFSLPRRRPGDGDAFLGDPTGSRSTLSWPRWGSRRRPPTRSTHRGPHRIRAASSWWSTPPRGRDPQRADGRHIHAAALANQVPCLTTVAAARAAAAGIADWRSHTLSVVSLQELHLAEGVETSAGELSSRVATS